MIKKVKKVEKRVGLRSWLRLHRQMADWIIRHGDKTLSTFKLITLIQQLDPEHYRQVFRCIIREVGVSNDREQIQRLTHELATVVDYILDEERLSKISQKLCC